MNLEENIRKIVVDELSRRQPEELTSVSEFCRTKNISRVTIWRAEKEGKLKLVRIGRKVFINPRQFYISNAL